MRLGLMVVDKLDFWSILDAFKSLRESFLLLVLLLL